MTYPLPDIQKTAPRAVRSSQRSEARLHVINGIVAGCIVIAILAVVGGFLFVRFPDVFIGAFLPKKGEVLQDRVIADLALTREVSALGSPMEPQANFTVDDKRYYLTLRIDDIPSETEIAVRWYEGTVLIGETAKRVTEDGWVSFSFEPATPHATHYRLEISRDGIRKTSVLFEVLP